MRTGSFTEEDTISFDINFSVIQLERCGWIGQLQNLNKNIFHECNFAATVGGLISLSCFLWCRIRCTETHTHAPPILKCLLMSSYFYHIRILPHCTALVNQKWFFLFHDPVHIIPSPTGLQKSLSNEWKIINLPKSLLELLSELKRGADHSYLNNFVHLNLILAILQISPGMCSIFMALWDKEKVFPRLASLPFI